MNANAVHTLDSRAELFVDDLLIASKRGMTRRLHQGKKHETPVIAPDDDNRPMGGKLGPWVENPFSTRSRYVMMTFQTGSYTLHSTSSGLNASRKTLVVLLRFP